MASQSGADTDIDTTNKTTTTTATTATTSVDANPHSSTEQPRDAGPTPNRGLTVGIICVLAGGLAMMWVVSNISFPQPAFDTIQWYALLGFVILYWAVAVRWIRTQNFKLENK
jgi:predicted lipid-binding transport protein (Tim44 family)